MAWGPRCRPGHPFLAGAPLLIAHRGGAGLAPENTVEACANALDRYDVDMFEVDVRLTGDGVVVVHHDPTVDRTTDGSGAVADLTYDELCDFDAGARFVDPLGERSFAGKGVKIPRLEEVLESFPDTRIILEIKEAAVAGPAEAILRRMGASERVLIGAEQEAWRVDAQGHLGPWGASRKQVLPLVMLHALPLRSMVAPAIDAIQVPVSHDGRMIVTEAFVADAHRRNIPVHVWTIDDPDVMRTLLALGVDGILTDRPDHLAGVLAESGFRRRVPEVT